MTTNCDEHPLTEGTAQALGEYMHGEPWVDMPEDTRLAYREHAAIFLAAFQGTGLQVHNTTNQAEAHPPIQRWSVETHDPAADEWIPGTPHRNRHHAVKRYEALTEQRPRWTDGTPVKRRIVREATQYSVEEQQ
ncbi:hypothetical protein [Streptomyces platensis]|uniref:hypothetical protein n=1 Tax=Streptomyces platensis TaxID=58346 RepID=UPI00332C10BA